MSLADLLAEERVEEFNAQRGQRRKIDLFASELAGLALSGVDLNNAYLEKSDLTGTDLGSANLVRADFTGVDATGATFSEATAVGARFKEAVLEGARLDRADLSHADLTEADLQGSEGRGVKLSSAKLRETDARQAKWPGADLTEARLHQAKLDKADLSGATLAEASVVECSFVGATLRGVKAPRMRAPGSSFAGADLSGALLDSADLSSCDLTGANLEGADLRRANLSNAKLAGARMRGAQLAAAVLDGVDLASVDLSGADLTGHDLRNLGLSSEQSAGLAAGGAVAIPDAPLHLADVTAARVGDTVGVIWENVDSDDAVSLRWAVVGAEGACTGVVPVAADTVLSRGIVADGDAFALIVLQERPGGAAMIRFPLSVRGEVGAPTADALGYEPAVAPLVRPEGDAAYVYGLARRGPTLVAQRLGGGAPVSAKVATARGFLGLHHPVLSCKGGVILPAGPNGLGAPVRPPPGLDGKRTAAAIANGRVLLAWVEPRKSEKDPGGLQFAWLEASGAPTVRTLTRRSGVASIDAIGDEDGVWLTWTEALGLARSVLYLARLPLPNPEGPAVEPAAPLRIDLDGHDPEEVRFAPGRAGAPHVAVTTADERLVVIDVAGRLVGELGDHEDA